MVCYGPAHCLQILSWPNAVFGIVGISKESKAIVFSTCLLLWMIMCNHASSIWTWVGSVLITRSTCGPSTQGSLATRPPCGCRRPLATAVVIGNGCLSNVELPRHGTLPARSCSVANLIHSCSECLLAVDSCEGPAWHFCLAKHTHLLIGKTRRSVPMPAYFSNDNLRPAV